MGEWKVRVLHISDLHERGPREKESFRRRRVLGSAWERNVDEMLEDGPLDLVCFTGDVADWGKPEEYGPVTGFLDALLERLKLPRERLFLVPGNHDIDRKKGLRAWRTLRGGPKKKGKLFSVDSLGLSRWMAGGAPPLGLERVSREDLLSRQDAYREWVATTLGRKELVPSRGSPHPFLGYRQTLRLPGQPFDIHVVGLDSSWLAGDEGDSGKLLLTSDQVGRLTTDSQGAVLSGFRLALIHHPLSDLADKSDSQRRLADSVDLLLRGHLHEEEIETRTDPDRTSRQVAAGCLYEGHGGDEWPNACHVIEVRLDDAGRPSRYDLRFRSWSKRGHWYNDDSLYAGSKNGRLTWWVGPRPVASVSYPLGTFVGRAPQLEAMKAALVMDGKRPVALCAVNGMPGVGKSYLAERFAQLHAEHFPGGCARLLLDPQSLSSVEALLDRLGDQLGLSSAGRRTAEQCRERMLRLRSLLIVENVDSREAAAVVGQLVSQLPECSIVVTGRFQGLGDDSGWVRIDVEAFDERTALELLEREFHPPRHERERQDFQRLLRDLGGLPLAIHLAVGYLKAGHSVESFLAKLQESRFLLEPVSPMDPSTMRDRARVIIRSTFEISMALLRLQLGTGEKSERLLSGLSALGHAPLSGFGRSLGTAIAGLSELEFGELIVSGFLLSLISRVPNTERTDDAWRIHPLLAELLREPMESAVGLARLTDWFVERLPELTVEQEPIQSQRWKEIHREHAALVDWLPRVVKADWIRVQRVGSPFAIIQGPFRVWMDYCERILNSTLSERERSNVLWTLANVASRNGEQDRAFSVAQQKVRLDKSRQDEHGAALAAGICADILQNRGELDEALRIRREEELPVYERLGDVRSRAVTMGKVADILQARGELDEALRIRREEQLPVFERLGDVRERAVTMGKVADILQDRGELDEALRIRREEQLPVFERLGDVLARAVTMGKVAEILQVRGELDEALRICREEELPVYERLGDVRSLLVCRANLALIYLVRNQPGDRETAAHLLGLARTAAESLHLPEARQILQIQRDHGLD